jgi:outer membrane protein assembly factor BamA
VWNVNKDTRVRFAAGYQHQTFDGPRTNFFVFVPFGLNQAVSPDLDAPYYSISFSQRLSDRVSHELAVGYESNLDSATNNSSSHFLNYSLSGETWKDGRVTVSAYYESSGESKQLLAADTTSCGLDLHLAQRITPKLTASVGYSFVHTSIETDANFFFPASKTSLNQHIAGVSLNYALTAKTQVQLAWQAFRSEWEDFGADVDHHRATLGIRVQF